MGIRRTRWCLLVVLASGYAFAAELPLTLFWQAPESCPQYDAVWAQLTQRLGRSLAAPERRSFAARGIVQPVEGGWALELQTLSESGAGTRKLTAPTCDELTRSAVIILAMAIDPTIQAPPAVPPFEVSLEVGPQTIIAPFPYPTVGASIGLRLARRPFSFGLSLDGSFSQRLVHDGRRSVSLSLPVGGRLEGCLGITRLRLTLDGCAFVRVSLALGAPEGVERPRVGSAPFLQSGLVAEGGVWVIPSVAVKLRLGVAVALTTPTFLFLDSEVWRVPRFGGEGALLLEYKLW